MGRVAILLLAALALPAQTPLRVAFLGTSITCGAGANERFLPLVERGLQLRYHRPVISYDLCFGGAHSLTTLLLLKHTALPWKPNLLIVETGALDGFAPELSLPALAQIFHEIAAAQIPAVFLARTAKCSEENTRPAILHLGREFGIPVADIPKQAMPDGCHPTNAGHAEIAAAIASAINLTTRPPSPKSPAPLPGARFQPAAQARLAGPDNPVPLTFFQQTGAALQAPPGPVEWRLQWEGTLAAVLFRLGHTPTAIEYQLDAQPWQKIALQPAWFLNYYLGTNLKPGPHTLTLRLQAGPEGVILDGLETVTPTPR
jgi:hypothetical protein